MGTPFFDEYSPLGLFGSNLRGECVAYIHSKWIHVPDLVCQRTLLTWTLHIPFILHQSQLDTQLLFSNINY